MNNFRKLNVWKKAVKLATAIYKQTNTLPKEECYGLTSQMRRGAVSIGSNIAEGAGVIEIQKMLHSLKKSII